MHSKHLFRNKNFKNDFIAPEVYVFIFYGGHCSVTNGFTNLCGWGKINTAIRCRVPRPMSAVIGSWPTATLKDKQEERMKEHVSHLVIIVINFTLYVKHHKNVSFERIQKYLNLILTCFTGRCMFSKIAVSCGVGQVFAMAQK